MYLDPWAVGIATYASIGARKLHTTTDRTKERNEIDDEPTHGISQGSPAPMNACFHLPVPTGGKLIIYRKTYAAFSSITSSTIVLFVVAIVFLFIAAVV